MIILPELPEVETVRRGLERLVLNKTVQEVNVLWPRIIESPSAEDFAALLIGETIEKMERRGKFLIFRFSHYDMLSHLRMEGKYEFHEHAQDALDKHTHVIFKFTDGTELRYLDVRKFGRMSLVPSGEALLHRSLAKLGPEPTQDYFELAPFQQKLRKYHKAIKPLLLEQTLVVGLGNIYVDETLWQAEIHPEQPADTLTNKEIERLHSAIIDVLDRAVKAGGSTIRTYMNALGEAGKFQRQLHVYGRTGEPCERCGTLIVKIKVAQRGTHFCPNCQKLRNRKPREHK